jgi:hypothetical protein
MKQVIFLGFYCQIYKKPPIARIYVGDVMIDEIEIPEFYTEEYLKKNKLWVETSKKLKERGMSTEVGWLGNDMELHPAAHESIHALDTHSWLKELPVSKFLFKDVCSKDTKIGTKTYIKHPKIFVYVIDNEILKTSEGKITIKIQNSDSNYVNGFMTKSTLLHLSTFYIIPYALFKDPIETTQRYLNVWSKKARQYSVKEIINYYKNVRINYPINLKGFFDLIQNSKKNNNDCVVGGDCDYEIELKKKYNIWWAKDIKNIGFFWINYIFIKDFIVDLSNKYKQNENQRNSD